MMDGLKIVIIANPTAGRLKDRRKIERFAGLLEDRGCETLIRWTKAAGFRNEEVDLDCEKDIIVAAGGDGTLHQVANALYHRKEKCPVAFLPLGTANLFSFEARLPRKREKLADLISRGEPRDYRTGWGRFNGLEGEEEERVFLLMAGAGWDARVTMAVKERVKNIHGKGAYILAGIGLLISGGGDKVALKADGRELEGDAAIIANSPYYAGSFILVPSAGQEKQTLSLAVIKKISLPGIIGMMRHARRREEDPSGNVIYREVKKIEVDLPDIPIQMDGDPVGFTPAVFEKAVWKIPVITGRE